MGPLHPEFCMTKLYGVEISFDDSLPLSEIIRDYFNCFSLDDLDYVNQYDGMYFTSFESAFNWHNWTGEDVIASLMIIEYSLTEEDLVTCFFEKGCRTAPTNVWYYWWDKEKNELKAISKQLAGFT